MADRDEDRVGLVLGDFAGFQILQLTAADAGLLFAEDFFDGVNPR